MTYLYLAAQGDVRLTNDVTTLLVGIKNATVTKYSSGYTIIRIQFMKPADPPTFEHQVLDRVTRAACDGVVRLVCSRHPILVGLTINNQLLWKAPLESNPDIVFVQNTQSYAPDAGDTLYPLTTHPPPGVFGRVRMVGGADVFARVTERGRLQIYTDPLDASRYVLTPTGRRVLVAWVIHKDNITHPCAKIVTNEILATGYHPIVAKDTINSMRMEIRSITVGKCVAHVTSMWSGDPMHPPVVLTADTVTTLVDIWADAVCAIGMGRDAKGAQAQQLMLHVREAVMDTSTTTQSIPPLEVGEHVAYLVNDIPPQDQHMIVTAEVTGLNPLELSNGHHATVFRDGDGELARYNVASGRVQFPVARLKSFSM